MYGLDLFSGIGGITKALEGYVRPVAYCMNKRELQPFLLSDGPWCEIKDGDPTGRALFRSHYSYRAYADGRDPKLFVGPGEKMVLITPSASALFVWRKFKSADGQQGVNCAVFRNEGNERSSDLIWEAMQLAWKRWPGQRLYTYVNPKKIRSRNPGYCFLKTGWRRVGITKHNKLIILEVLPGDVRGHFDIPDKSGSPAIAECSVSRKDDH